MKMQKAQMVNLSEILTDEAAEKVELGQVLRFKDGDENITSIRVTSKKDGEPIWGTIVHLMNTEESEQHAAKLGREFAREARKKVRQARKKELEMSQHKKNKKK